MFLNKKSRINISLFLSLKFIFVDQIKERYLILKKIFISDDEILSANLWYYKYLSSNWLVYIILLNLKKKTYQIDGGWSFQSITLVGTTFFNSFVVHSPCKSRPRMRMNGNIDDPPSANYVSKTFNSRLWLRWI